MTYARSVLVVLGLLALAGCAGVCCPRSSQPCCPPPPCGVAGAAAPTTAVPAPPVAAGPAAPLDRAIEAALSAQAGLVLEAGYEEEGEGNARKAIIEVMVLDAAGRAMEVQIDPASGRVTQAAAADEPDEAQELGALAKALPKEHLPLADLVRRAAAGGGTPVAAGFRAKAGAPAVAVVVLRSGGKTRRIALDPVSGAVRPGAHEDEDEEDEADEKPAKPGHDEEDEHEEHQQRDPKGHG